MKKKILLPTFAVAMLLTGCGNTPAPTSSGSSAPSSSSPGQKVTGLQATFDTSKTYYVGDVINKTDIQVTASYEGGGSSVVTDWTSSFFATSSHTLTDEECTDRTETISISYGGKDTSVTFDAFDGRITVSEWNDLLNYLNSGDGHKFIMNKTLSVDGGAESKFADYYVDGDRFKLDMVDSYLQFIPTGCVFAEITEVNEASQVRSLITDNKSKSVMINEIGYVIQGGTDTRVFSTETRSYTMPDGTGLSMQAKFDYIDKAVVPTFYKVETFANNFLISRFQEYGTYEMPEVSVPNLIDFDSELTHIGETFTWEYSGDVLCVTATFDEAFYCQFNLRAEADIDDEGGYFDYVIAYKNGTQLNPMQVISTDYDLYFDTEEGDTFDFYINFSSLNPNFKTGVFNGFLREL